MVVSHCMPIKGGLGPVRGNLWIGQGFRIVVCWLLSEPFDVYWVSWLRLMNWLGAVTSSAMSRENQFCEGTDVKEVGVASKHSVWWIIDFDDAMISMNHYFWSMLGFHQSMKGKRKRMMKTRPRTRFAVTRHGPPTNEMRSRTRLFSPTWFRLLFEVPTVLFSAKKNHF